MAKVELKQPIVQEISENIKDAQSVVVVDYRGLTVAEDTQLRKALREAGVTYKVYKNTLVSRAIEGTEFESLKDVGIAYVVFDGVDPNPTDLNVEEGVKIYKDSSCDAMIAFGGGSPMDCAKGIGARIARPKKSIAKLQGLFKVLKRIPTIFTVPTTAGTGSETTIAAVITEAKTHHKASINDLSLMPKYAVLDPELTLGLPPKTTATTGMDALAHAVEAYTNNTYNSKLEKDLSKKATKLIYDNLLKVYENPKDIADQIKEGIQNKPNLFVEDRYEAIRQAIDNASKGDVVLILGKGDEPFMYHESGRVPWVGDNICAVECLKAAGYAENIDS